MDHSCLKDLTPLYHIHLWLASAPFLLSYKLNLQKVSLFLSWKYLMPFIIPLYPTLNKVSHLITSISVLVQNEMGKTSISPNKSEGIMSSGNKVNPRGEICWKILVLLTKINLRQFKNDQKLL